jgi:hypothetical protein
MGVGIPVASEFLRPSVRTVRVVVAAMSFAIFGSIVVAPSAAWAVPVPWRNCGTPGDAISIQQINASVWPPQAGKSLTVSYRLNLAEPLLRGAFEHVTTTWPSGQTPEFTLPFQLPVEELFRSALLPHLAVKPGTLLPFLAGPYSETFTLTVPRTKPSTFVTHVLTQPVGVHLTGYDSAGHEVVCMQLVVPIK